MTATFALTFDTELIWGSFDEMAPGVFQTRYPDIRGTIHAILRLLEAYEVSATWAVIGHLYLPGCTRDPSGTAHPELVHPRQSWWREDWYSRDPCTDLARDPLWYGRDILDALQAASTPQEIGCHSFSHALYGDPELTREAVNSDLDACLALAANRGIALRSFVFPRNSEGHHAALRDHGFTAYRGVDPARYRALPGPIARVAHLADHAMGLAPPVSEPVEMLPGLWNIPGSTLLIHRLGARRLISMASRRRKSNAGLQRAMASGGVFHLWTHPFNLASDRAFMLAALEMTLRAAVEARDRGQLVIESMGQIAERMAERGSRADADPGEGAATGPPDAQKARPT